MIGEEVRKPAVKVDLNTSGGDEIVSKVVYKDSVSRFPTLSSRHRGL